MESAPTSHLVQRWLGLRRHHFLPLFIAVQILGIAVAIGSTGLIAQQPSSHTSSPAPSVRATIATPRGSQPSPPSSAASTTQVTSPASTVEAEAISTAKAKRSAPPKMHATTTTTSVVPKTAHHGLALGFAVWDSAGSQFQNYQSAVGKLPNFVEWYTAWPNSEAGAGPDAPLYSASQEQSTVENHLIPLISWGSDDIPLTAIVNGSEDATTLAPAVVLAKSYPGTLYIRLDWEMNGSWAPYSWLNPDQPAGETPATFVAMWQHVVNYFRAAGVSNVKWVWSPNVDGGTGTMAAYYPGDGYVDDVGLDGYNYAYYQGSWVSPQQVFGASYTGLESITHKPVIVAETSSVEANSAEASQGLSKALWMQQLSAYLPSLSNVIAVCWFDQPTPITGSNSQNVDFSVNSSSASLAAWEKYFVDNAEYQGSLS
jgi:mannan endo-1,4-beta-mannosidase